MDPIVLVPMLVAIVFVIVFATIAAQLLAGLVVWSRNNLSPRRTVPARVVSRRTEIRGRGSSRVWTSYFATFELKSGERLEFGLYGKDYGLLAEGDQGTLSFQGTRYLGFRRGW